MSIINKDASFSHHYLAGDACFPNNQQLPVLLYKHVLLLGYDAANNVKQLLAENGWSNAWMNGIFTYHHYHSTAHELLAIISGNCMVQPGGDDGSIQAIMKGDVLVLPAGTAHKNVHSSEDFACVGAYAGGREYDTNYGKPEELEAALANILQVPMPDKDPIFGSKGPLIDKWKHKPTNTMIEAENQF